MLERKAMAQLERWHSTKGNQALIVTGARQVGKTYLVERFAERHYDNLVKIDFIERPEAVDVILGARDARDLLVRITALADAPLEEGKTLFFFDEIQRCGDIITWLKYLVSDGRFDVICSGSMLGTEVYDYRSYPVGTVDVFEMFPLDFEEFSWARGMSPSLWDEVRGAYESRTPLPDYLHERFMEEYRAYVLVGGMPEAVETFVSTSDTQRTRARQAAILNAYRADITRYVADAGHAQRIKTIYDAIPGQLNRERKRFFVNGIDKARRFDALAPDFDWLVAAGVVLRVTRVSEPAFPVGLSLEPSYFKLYLNDVGLLFSTLTKVDVLQLLQGETQINYGAPYENAVAQELAAHGHELRYFSSKKYGEVDFLLERGKPVVTLVEVKSGKESHKHKALDNLMAVPNWPIDEALVLHPYNLATFGKVTYLPIYMAGLL